MIQPNLAYKYNEISKSAIIVFTLRETPQKFQIIMVICEISIRSEQENTQKT